MGVATKIFHPFRPGLFAESDNADDLGEMLIEIKAEIDKMRACESELRRAIGQLAAGEAKTERVVGERVTLKVQWPDDYWDQTALKTLWNDMPSTAKEYLRISSLSPMMREVKKLENSSGDGEFQWFKRQLLNARLPSTAPPTVSVEKK